MADSDHVDSEAQVHGPRPTKSAVFSVRFPGDELWEVRRAARDAKVSVGEFIRRSALDRARARGVPAAFAGAMGRTLSDLYTSYTAAGSPSGESLDAMIDWLDGGTAQEQEPPGATS